MQRLLLGLWGKVWEWSDLMLNYVLVYVFDCVYWCVWDYVVIFVPDNETSGSNRTLLGVLTQGVSLRHIPAFGRWLCAHAVTICRCSDCVLMQCIVCWCSCLCVDAVACVACCVSMLWSWICEAPVLFDTLTDAQQSWRNDGRLNIQTSAHNPRNISYA